MYLLGIAGVASKGAGKGLEEVGAYVRANPKWARGYDVLGELQVQTGLPKQGEQTLAQALRLSPKLVTTQLGLSQALAAQGKYDEALGILQQLVGSNPRVSAAYMQMAQISERKGDWKGAESGYQKALAICSDKAIAKNNLAWIYAEHGGNIDVALKLAQEAKDAVPNNPNISDTLGWILVKTENYQNAIQELRAAVQENPKQALYDYHLAVAYFHADQKVEAKQGVEAALKIQPTFSDAASAKQLLAALSK